jgi:hypothetical protein
MKIEKLKPGMTVYTVIRRKMGNTNISTVVVYPVTIVSVEIENCAVVASVNGNPNYTYYKSTWSKWRRKPPLLIRSITGSARIARRGE